MGSKILTWMPRGLYLGETADSGTLDMLEGRSHSEGPRQCAGWACQETCEVQQVLCLGRRNNLPQNTLVMFWLGSSFAGMGVLAAASWRWASNVLWQPSRLGVPWNVLTGVHLPYWGKLLSLFTQHSLDCVSNAAQFWGHQDCQGAGALSLGGEVGEQSLFSLERRRMECNTHLRAAF